MLAFPEMFPSLGFETFSFEELLQGSARPEVAQRELGEEEENADGCADSQEDEGGDRLDEVELVEGCGGAAADLLPPPLPHELLEDARLVRLLDAAAKWAS